MSEMLLMYVAFTGIRSNVKSKDRKTDVNILTGKLLLVSCKSYIKIFSFVVSMEIYIA